MHGWKALWGWSKNIKYPRPSIHGTNSANHLVFVHECPFCNCMVIYWSSVADVARRVDDLRNWIGTVSFLHKEHDDLMGLLCQREIKCMFHYTHKTVLITRVLKWNGRRRVRVVLCKSPFHIVLLQGQTHKANGRACQRERHASMHLALIPAGCGYLRKFQGTDLPV